MRPVFDAFRTAVLALDPGISEEVLKLYGSPTRPRPISWTWCRKRADYGWSLNLRFHELHDPRGLAKDVTNLGRWGNGDAEVGLSTLRSFPTLWDSCAKPLRGEIGNGAGEA